MSDLESLSLLASEGPVYRGPMPTREISFRFGPRPHWGKLFLATARDLEPRYERLPDFRRLAERLDSRRVFRNAFLERHIFG